MATIPPTNLSSFVTFGHVVASLPDIPLSRIRLAPTPGTATEADVLHVRASERVLCELFDGVLVEKPMGYEESIIAQNILAALHTFVKEHDLGVVAGEGGMLRLSTSQVRIPDGSFVSWDQLPGRAFPREPVWGVHPDLALEVLSESNTRGEMTRKIDEYFAAGARLVWIVDPPAREVRVHTSPAAVQVLSIADTLMGGDVLPGFSCPVRQIFPA